MIRGVGHSIAFHIDGMGESQDFQAGSREGIWWLASSSASDYLILTNQGGNPLQLDLSLFDASGKASTQKLILAPHATNRLSVRQLVTTAGLTGSYGGVKISAATHAGSLDTLHVLFDEKAGFSAIMKMFRYDPTAQIKERDYANTGIWTLRAPMLALSNPDPALAFPVGTTLHPQLFVRNTTGKPIGAALLFNWRGDTATGKSPGPALRLGPYETRRIDVAALQDGKTLPQNAHWTSVTLTANSNPDEVMAVAASYDQSLHYGAQTPFSDQLAFHWAGSMWEFDPYHNSIITVGNGGTKPTQAAFTIFYNQGTQKYELEQTLQPDEQMWIDVGKLIREHVPDKNGSTLPADLTAGSYEIRDLTNKGVGTLFEGKVIYDKTYGHVTYGCGLCCGYKRVQLWFDPLGIPFRDISYDGVNGLDACTSHWDDTSDPFYGNWSTANSTIATVDYYGTHTGQAVGSTRSATFGTFQGWRPGTVNCPTQGGSPGGGDNVMPQITSVSPSRGLIGATTSSVTITGKGFTGGQVNTTTTAIQAQNVTVSDDQHITLNLVISSTATTGNNAQVIYVTASGENSNKVDFYVQVPTSVSMVSGTAKGTTEYICGSGNCGTIVSFKYQVYDQDSPAAQPIQASMSMWDSFGSFSPDNLHMQGVPFKTTCSPNQTNSGPCGVNTNADGTFTEAALGACSTVCYVNGACTTGGPSGVPQTWNIAGYAIVQQISEYCQKVLVNGTQVQ